MLVRLNFLSPVEPPLVSGQDTLISQAKPPSVLYIPHIPNGRQKAVDASYPSVIVLMKPSVMVSCAQRRLGLDEDVVSAPLPTKEVGLYIYNI
jgi:hypothetical protein